MCLCTRCACAGRWSWAVSSTDQLAVQITAEGDYACLCTFLETILTMIWCAAVSLLCHPRHGLMPHALLLARYPSCVATLSRRAKDVIEAAFEKSVDGGHQSLLVGSRLHDFGFRGCTCVEQSVIGGCAHLLNFDGSDTMSAGYYAQFMLNDGRPVAQSIPASEHRCVTPRDAHTKE